jgi:soluble lytic murein transglycosylase-like protein
LPYPGDGKPSPYAMSSIYNSQICSAAQAQGVDCDLAIAVSQAESGGNQYQNNGSLVVNSSSGATGIFQLLPSTAAGLGVDPTDPTQNIQGGVTYLSQMLNQFNGDIPSALAAYNWGPGNVATYGAAAAPASTQTYVASILNQIGYSSSSSGSGISNSNSGISNPTEDSSLPSWVPAVALTVGAAGLAYLIL